MTLHVRLSRIGSATLAIVAVTVAGTAVAGPAQAAPTGVAKVYSSTKVEYRAAGGKTNSVVVTRSGRVITIDDRVAVKAGKGCKAVRGDRTKVRCTTSKTPTWVRVYTGDKNDSVVNNTDLGMSVRAGGGNNTITGGPKHDELFTDGGNDKIYGRGGDDYIYSYGGRNTIDGGPGEDELYGGEGKDKIFGGPGTDRMDGGEGNDVVRGGDGDDYFEESPGRDVLYGEDGMDEFFQNGLEVGAQDMHGGPGADRVDYWTRTKAVHADPDGKKGDDGQKGEGDTIGTDIEMIFGGEGNDTITGGPDGSYLDGGPGNDKLSGLGGRDSLLGGIGNDRLSGGAGDDDLTGDFGTDVMLGGLGVDTVSYSERLVTVTADLDGVTGDDGSQNEKDTIGADVENLYGGWGNDKLTGNAAANVIDGGNGADVIRGGAGNDQLATNDGARDGVDKVYGEAGDDELVAGYDEDDHYLLDGGPNDTALGDSCRADHPGSGEFVDCER